MAGDPPFPPIQPCCCCHQVQYYRPLPCFTPTSCREEKLEALLTEVKAFLNKSMFLVGAEELKRLVKELE